LVWAACWRARISEFFDIFLHKAETGSMIIVNDKLADRTCLVACPLWREKQRAWGVVNTTGAKEREIFLFESAVTH
jgi:hypothetical protein